MPFSLANEACVLKFEEQFFIISPKIQFEKPGDKSQARHSIHQEYFSDTLI